MRIDVFCKVIDNFGDAAVCWRLARQLAAEHGAEVRLYLDQLQALALLRPDLSASLAVQHMDGVTVCRWSSSTRFDHHADVIIEGFGCGLPDDLVIAMAARKPAPAWIILEYLSAEPWVDAHHGLPSPHPRLALSRDYFFPGFSARTGGLLREADLIERRDAFWASTDQKNALWRDLGCVPPAKDDATCVISLFGYDNVNATPLLESCVDGPTKTLALVPPGRLRNHVGAFFGVRSSADGDTFSRGALTVRNIPFLGQTRYDELLWVCDWNFVRGEDSFVRAQWAARPLVWQAYPQSEGAHLKKVEAFLTRYTEGVSGEVASRLRRLYAAWNGMGQLRLEDWRALRESQAILTSHAARWARDLSVIPDLAANLAHYCVERLK